MWLWTVGSYCQTTKCHERRNSVFSSNILQMTLEILVMTLTDLTVFAAEVWFAPTDIRVDPILTLTSVLAGRRFTLVTVYTGNNQKQEEVLSFRFISATIWDVQYEAGLTNITGPEFPLKEKEKTAVSLQWTIYHLCVWVCVAYSFFVVLEALPGLLHGAGLFSALPLQVVFLKLLKAAAVVAALTDQHRVRLLLRHKHSWEDRGAQRKHYSTTAVHTRHGPITFCFCIKSKWFNFDDLLTNPLQYFDNATVSYMEETNHV